MQVFLFVRPWFDCVCEYISMTLYECCVNVSVCEYFTMTVLITPQLGCRDVCNLKVNRICPLKKTLCERDLHMSHPYPSIWKYWL